MCYAFDALDSTGNTLLVGNDCGAFLSHDFGKTWSSDYNRTLTTRMFDTPGESSKPALSASETVEELVVGAFQDNGKAYLSGDGEPWRELGSVGDGFVAVFVTGDVVMSGGNDSDGDLKWAQWDGTKFGAEVKLEPLGYPGSFLPHIARIPDPQRKDGSGALMVAVACDDGNSGKIWGRFDRGAGYSPLAQRFSWTELASVAVTGLYAIASFTGHIIVVGGIKGSGPSAAPCIYLVDSVTGVAAEATLPPGAPANTPRWISLCDESSGFALQKSTLWRTNDLMSWSVVPTALPGQLSALAIDRETDPVRLIVASSDGVWTSRDFGVTWQPTIGHPKHPQANHLEVVKYPSGRRVAHMGTWNWSLWRAELS